MMDSSLRCLVIGAIGAVALGAAASDPAARLFPDPNPEEGRVFLRFDADHEPLGFEVEPGCPADRGLRGRRGRADPVDPLRLDRGPAAGRERPLGAGLRRGRGPRSRGASPGGVRRETSATSSSSSTRLRGVSRTRKSTRIFHSHSPTARAAWTRAESGDMPAPSTHGSGAARQGAAWRRASRSVRRTTTRPSTTCSPGVSGAPKGSFCTCGWSTEARPRADSRRSGPRSFRIPTLLAALRGSASSDATGIWWSWKAIAPAGWTSRSTTERSEPTSPSDPSERGDVGGWRPGGLHRERWKTGSSPSPPLRRGRSR